MLRREFFRLLGGGIVSTLFGGTQRGGPVRLIRGKKIKYLLGQSLRSAMPTWKSKPDQPVDNLATAHYVSSQLLTNPKEVEVSPEGTVSSAGETVAPSENQEKAENPLPKTGEETVESTGEITQSAQNAQPAAPTSEASVSVANPEGQANEVSVSVANKKTKKKPPTQE